MTVGRSENVELVDERTAAAIEDGPGDVLFEPEQGDEGELPGLGQLASDNVLDGVSAAAFSCVISD